MSWALPARAWATAAIALLFLASGSRARAATEEFSTFDVEAQEEDDESLLDHVLLRPPATWRDEWERAPQAIRTSQGCLTSGRWFIDTDLKLRSPLGTHARMGLDVRQSESDVASYEYFDFSFKFPIAIGTPGAMFRPLFDKSRQDFALTWDAGTDSSRTQGQLVFTFEDMFNNLWSWRQTSVGGVGEPYSRHPYEPGFWVVHRGERVRLELSGRYLTPSRKDIAALSGPRVATLWGTLGAAAIEARAFGLTWEARGSNQQASSTDQPADLSSGDGGNFRRRWIAETAVRGRPIPRLATELRWIYEDRSQNYDPPIGPSTFGAIDRLLVLDGLYEVRPTLAARFGLMHDRIGVAQSGVHQAFTYGTRKESRAYIALIARFGRVSVQGIEGIELDSEPYDVWFVHDKGFLHLQTTF